LSSTTMPIVASGGTRATAMATPGTASPPGFRCPAGARAGVDR
jgi:hypothetical protein